MRSDGLKVAHQLPMLNRHSFRFARGTRGKKDVRKIRGESSTGNVLNTLMCDSAAVILKANDLTRKAVLHFLDGRTLGDDEARSRFGEQNLDTFTRIFG